MKTIFKQISLLALSVFLVASISSCEATKNANNKQKGAVIGAASGAVIGAILGNNVGKGGNGEMGAVIGGVVGGTAGVLIGAKMDKQAKKIEEEIPGAQVERVDDGIVITFDENSGVHFDTAKYNINAASQATLDKLTGVLREYPDTNVLVVGHTDSVGSDESNMVLSKNRAMAVTNYFTGTKGLSAGRFTTNWFGEQSPVGDNSTVEGRAQNRRVNVVIVPNEKMKEDAQKQADGN
ncbi:outer membrane protein OmpA-like peptidoglycan-associated protein [Ulvibacter sp. MAR_2010_11]|uniref:OmpA family protein n=1 Tax=Ulvibacter sp. MAR_2010_11 TaxID=1250229 RepID=UPI000C2C6814|nr:OmpA family protein [Ulvibacter sp. MAR_2010_11]PKA84197.1 outer membrane protein OmpA-like peptidoglycan-associated protein [Ulvibacter sp. MAR_2010_11]